MSYGWLEQLRARPKHERKAIAFGGAATITSMIALIWMVNTVTGLNVHDQTAAVGAVQQKSSIVESINTIERLHQEGMQGQPTTEEQFRDLNNFVQQLEQEAVRNQQFDELEDGQDDAIGADSIYNVDVIE